MIITRTPYRMSFFGGGTDFPNHYMSHGGQVLSTTFNKYCYISCRTLPPFFEHKHRIVYSKVESVSNVSDIQHPAVRAILSEYDCSNGLEIHHDGDLPARSGLGSSSSFVVGLLHALRAMQGEFSSKKCLADEALRIEQDVLRENVGSQDQIAAAFGGFNNIIFHLDGSYSVNPVIANQSRIKDLNENLMLFFTGLTRISSDIARDQIDNTRVNYSALSSMNSQVTEALKILANPAVNLDEFGKLMDDAWNFKRSLSTKISSSYIDELYSAAKSRGAFGGKLLGAGGGGFMLLYAKPEDHVRIKKELRNLVYIPFRFETSGSTINVYQPDMNY